MWIKFFGIGYDVSVGLSGVMSVSAVMEYLVWEDYACVEAGSIESPLLSFHES